MWWTSKTLWCCIVIFACVYGLFWPLVHGSRHIYIDYGSDAADYEADPLKWSYAVSGGFSFPNLLKKLSTQYGEQIKAYHPQSIC